MKAITRLLLILNTFSPEGQFNTHWAHPARTRLLLAIVDMKVVLNVSINSNHLYGVL